MPNKTKQWILGGRLLKEAKIECVESCTESLRNINNAQHYTLTNENWEQKQKMKKKKKKSFVSSTIGTKFLQWAFTINFCR